MVNGDENEPCATSQTLGPRVTLPIQCVRGGGVSATGRFLTLYRMRDQASDMYVCQVLVFLACERGEGGRCRERLPRGGAAAFEGPSLRGRGASLRLLAW